MTSWYEVLFLNELDFICLYNSFAIVSTQLNGLNNCYQTVIILFNINELFEDCERLQVLLCNTNNSIHVRS